MLNKQDSEIEIGGNTKSDAPHKIIENTILTKLGISNCINPRLENALKLLEAFEIKTVSRNCSNNYVCGKTKKEINRKETAGEHVNDCFKIADFFILTEEEFKDLDRLKVHDLISYHEDVEIVADDVCMSDREKRKLKKDKEEKGVIILAGRYPKKMNTKLLEMDVEFKNGTSAEARFVRAIDRFHPLLSELKYPGDRGSKKKFDEKNVREWFTPQFEYSKTFIEYFEDIILFLRENLYFED